MRGKEKSDCFTYNLPLWEFSAYHNRVLENLGLQSGERSIWGMKSLALLEWLGLYFPVFF